MVNVKKSTKLFALIFVAGLTAWLAYSLKTERPIVHRFLDAVASNDLDLAYWEFTTEEFQKTTSNQDFTRFIQSNPVLTHHKVVGTKLGPDETVIAELETKQGRHEVAFAVEQEHGEDKIQNFQLFKPANEWAKATDKISIDKIVVGLGADKKGLVENVTDTVPSDADAIYVNVYIQHGKKGEGVKLYLTHIESGQEALPLSTMLQQDGDAMVSFSYTAPLDGWPDGQYQVEARTDGVSLSSRFTIEKKSL